MKCNPSLMVPIMRNLSFKSVLSALIVNPISVYWMWMNKYISLDILGFLSSLITTAKLFLEIDSLSSFSLNS